MRSSSPEPSWTLLSSTFATSTAIVCVSSSIAALRSVERSRLYVDAPFDREVDQEHCPGRSRVVGGHTALTDVRLDVLVTESEVVPAGIANLVGEYRRGPIRPLPVRIEEAVAHTEAPAPRVAAGKVGERLEAGLVLFHRAAPHDRVERREVDGLPVQLADQMHVARARGEVVPVVDRVRAQHVVVSGQDDDRLAKPRELSPHELDGLVGRAVVIEEIAGDQEQVDLVAQRSIDDALERAPFALAVRGLLARVTVAVALEVDIGGVKDSQGPSRRGHDQQHATFSVHNAAMAPSAGTPQEWLRTFEAVVRARDFAGGRELFATDAMAFGTWARAVAGLDNIVREQWQNVWPRIRDFRFEPGAQVHASLDGAVAGYVFFGTGYNTDIAARAMWLHDIFVIPAARGRGVGHALMAAVAAETVRMGGGSLEWGVHSANAGALEFYARLGAVGGEAKIMGVAGARLRALAGL